MAQSTGSPQPCLAVRGSEGLFLHEVHSSNPPKPVSNEECRVMEFSRDGQQLACCDGKSVMVLDMPSGTLKYSIPKPKTRHMRFSPLGTYLATWEPYTTTKENPVGSPNLQVLDSRGAVGAEYIHKRGGEWWPQWSDDEQLVARNVTNEVHCFNNRVPGGGCDNKLQIAGLTSYAISKGKPPYKLVVYVPGTKGAPSYVRMFEYPNLRSTAVIASRSFYRADTVSFNWNSKGSAVLVTTTTEVDKTGGSYYGEQGLHYLSSRGEGNMVQLAKKGPIYDIEWNPNSEDFCVVYGFMPAKATIFNSNCDPVFEFGTGHFNAAKYNPHGNMLSLAGFGNLRGDIVIWDRAKLTKVNKLQASDSTLFEWSPDGVHFVTATTAPRLREGNGYKVWHICGSMVHKTDTPAKKELLEVRWRPFPPGSFPTPDPAARAAALTTPLPSQPATGKAAAYRPPALRGKPYTYKLHEEEPPQVVGGADESEKLSKSALRNKKKREAKQKSRDQESVGVKRGADQQDALALASQVLRPTTTVVTPPAKTDNEKKIKNLRKKLQAIEQLKQQVADGKSLEANQLDKIKTEGGLREELDKLTLSD